MMTGREKEKRDYDRCGIEDKGMGMFVFFSGGGQDLVSLRRRVDQSWEGAFQHVHDTTRMGSCDKRTTQTRVGNDMGGRGGNRK
jgi:hypothetical protein